MFSRKRILSVLGTLSVVSAASLLSACNGEETFYYDYLSASGTVFGADGTTPVGNVPLLGYDWIVSYKDGSTVAVPFDNVATTAASSEATPGTYAFNTTELQLNSGILQESCRDVCVAESIGWEDVCYDYDYEDYCVAWDEYGDCYSWDTDTYCASWGVEPYTYCSAWGQDCDYYYPARNVHDIAKAYSEITYSTGGSSTTTTSSEWYTVAADAVSTVSVTDKDKVTTVDETWTQYDEFITPLLSSSARKVSDGKASLTAEQLAKVKAHNDIKFPNRKAHGIALDKDGNVNPKPLLGRHHPKKKTARGKLSEAEQALIDIARKTCGATPRTSPLQK